MNFSKKPALKIILFLISFIFLLITQVDPFQLVSESSNENLDIEDTSQNEKKIVKNQGAENKINKELMENLDTYLNEIKMYTGFEIDNTQKNNLISYINKEPVYNLPSTETATKRKDFDSKRKKLIALWEEHYNRKWPKYTEDVIEKGKAVRLKGQNYDAHHIIELSWNGPNEWWNLTPAMYPSQHQNGIHSQGSIASKIFS